MRVLKVKGSNYQSFVYTVRSFCLQAGDMLPIVCLHSENRIHEVTLYCYICVFRLIFERGNVMHMRLNIMMKLGYSVCIETKVYRWSIGHTWLMIIIVLEHCRFLYMLTVTHNNGVSPMKIRWRIHAFYWSGFCSWWWF